MSKVLTSRKLSLLAHWNISNYATTQQLLQTYWALTGEGAIPALYTAVRVKLEGTRRTTPTEYLLEFDPELGRWQELEAFLGRKIDRTWHLQTRGTNWNMLQTGLVKTYVRAWYDKWEMFLLSLLLVVVWMCCLKANRVYLREDQW